jgi:hypothetical protein
VNLMANMVVHMLVKFAVNVFIYRTWVGKPFNCIRDIIER